MIKRILLETAIIAGIVLLILLVLIGQFVYGIWYQNSYKTLVQRLEVPEENAEFVLLTDIAGVGDRAWYVYRLQMGAGPTREMRTAHDETGTLFWNYSESGHHSDNEKLQILKDRYLVFSRGGLFHSLYDLKSQQVLANDESPWHSFYASEQVRSLGETPTSELDFGAMDSWVRNNLHRKIERIVEGVP